MLQYDIVSDKIYLSDGPDFLPDLVPFKNEVNKRIGQGWEPLGGNSITKFDPNFVLITQTIVKEV